VTSASRVSQLNLLNSFASGLEDNPTVNLSLSARDKRRALHKYRKKQGTFNPILRYGRTIEGSGHLTHNHHHNPRLGFFQLTDPTAPGENSQL
jgi:hypothetical protein